MKKALDRSLIVDSGSVILHPALNNAFVSISLHTITIHQSS